MKRTLMQKVASRFRGPPPRNKTCAVCQQAVVDFAPYRGGWSEAPEFMRAIDMVGSDIDHFSCPSCHSHDRERHLLLYLGELGLLDRFRGAALLHFAPEKRLQPIFESLQPARYVRGDLFPSEPGIECIDLMQIPYGDESFDIVIANHVLEHVADDRRGLRELSRVLRPGGFAILQTPYSARLHATLEDPGIDDDASRLAVYGQEDHVRLYGRDIFQRFSDCGLTADVQRHESALPEIDPIRHGVNLQEPLFLFRRR